MAQNNPPRFFYGYVVAVAAMFVMAIMWGAFSSFGVFFKPMLSEFGWTRAITSGAYSFSVLISGIVGILTGRLNDKLGPRIVVVGCSLLLGLGFVCMSLISSVWHMYFFFGIIAAIGLSGSFVPALSTTARWFIKRRGLMVGITASGAGLGMTFIPPAATWLIADYGWRNAYIILGIAITAALIVAALFLRRDPGQLGQLPYGANDIKPEGIVLEKEGFSLREALHTWQFWVLCGVAFCCYVCMDTIILHIVPHATDLQISAANAASILAIIGGFNIAGRIIMGGTGDRIGTRRALIITFVLMTVSLAWLLVAKRMWMFYPFAAVFGFGYAGVATLLSLGTAWLFGLSSHGVILGVIVFASTFGSLIGPVIAGGIFDITSSYYMAFLMLVVFSIIGIILSILLKPTGIEKTPTAPE